jgi:protein O-GlcNAc transferase
MPTTAELFGQALQLHQAGNLDQAESLYRQILQADPDHADAHHLVGVVAYQKGDHALSIAEIAKALALKPNYAFAHCNFANALLAQGKPVEAIAHFRQALVLEPDYPEAHYNLGNTLLKEGKVDEAIDSYRQALRINPNLVTAGQLAETCNHVADALARQQRLDEADLYFREALQLKPDFAEAHFNLGNLKQVQSKNDEAITCYRQALAIRPNWPTALHCLGEVFLRQGRLDQALASFQEAMQPQPDSAKLHSKALFCLSHDSQLDPDALFAEHRRFGQLREPASPSPTHANNRDPERRLRIGYVSPDLHQYGAMPRYLEPVFANHNAQVVELFCYTDVQNPDSVTARLQSLVKGWRSTWNLTDAQLDEQIRSDGIDILVDLSGHGLINRLCVFASKPAPVQVTWLGYLNTTGLTTMDYRLTDDVLDPPGQPVRDTEELIRLPCGMCCFCPPADAPPVAPLPALLNGYLTFGSLHRLIKLNDEVLDLWSKVLHAMPDSRLLMFHDTLLGTAQDRIRKHLVERGIASDRLDLRHGTCSPGYLGIYNEIDVSLDVFPWSGGVTTCESLWMGVPVLTLSGVRPASRNTAAILARVGLAEWTSKSPEEFVALGVRLPTNLGGLAELRTGLRDRMSATLCDAKGFTQALEVAYRRMWKRWCAAL